MYEAESQKIVLQSRVEDYQTSEKVRIYHHEQHKKLVKRSAILKLETPEEVLEGHDACSLFLSSEFEKLLLKSADLDGHAQSILLAEVDQVFTEEDNLKLKTPPIKAFIKNVLFNSNLNAAPGTDGLTSFLYKELWPLLGD